MWSTKVLFVGTSANAGAKTLDAAIKEWLVLRIYPIRTTRTGSSGTSIFRNQMEGSGNSRFKHAFNRLVFAILGNAT